MPITPPTSSDQYPQDINGNPIAYGGTKTGGAAGPSASWNGLFIPGYGGASVSSALSFNQNVLSWVCAQDPYCCDNNWDPKCVQLAAYAVNVSGISAGVLGVTGVNLVGDEYLAGCISGCSDTLTVMTNVGTYTLSAGSHHARGMSSWDTLVDHYGNYNCIWYYYNFVEPSPTALRDITLWFDTYQGRWVCRATTFFGTVTSFVSIPLNTPTSVPLSGINSYTLSISATNSAPVFSTVAVSGGYNPPCLPCAGKPNREPFTVRQFETYHQLIKPTTYSGLYVKLDAATSPLSAGKYTLDTSITNDLGIDLLVKSYGSDSTFTNFVGNYNGESLFLNVGDVRYFKVYSQNADLTNLNLYNDFGLKFTYYGNLGPGDFNNALVAATFSASADLNPVLPCYIFSDEVGNPNNAGYVVGAPIGTPSFVGALIAPGDFENSTGAIFLLSSINNESSCSIFTEPSPATQVLSAPISGFQALGYLIGFADFVNPIGTVLDFNNEINSLSSCSILANAPDVAEGIDSIVPIHGLSETRLVGATFNNSTGNETFNNSIMTEPFCSIVSLAKNQPDNSTAIVPSSTAPISAGVLITLNQ